MSQHLVSAPFLAEFNRSAFKVAMILFEFRFKARQQGKGVSGSAGKPGQDFVVVKPANINATRLNDGFTHRHLTVTGQCHAPISTNQQNSCAAHLGRFSLHVASHHYRNSREPKSSSAH
jgi:hypothetical protein